MSGYFGVLAHMRKELKELRAQQNLKSASQVAYRSVPLQKVYCHFYEKSGHED